MFKPPEHSRNPSMVLSEVLQDIGVTETMVMKTRRAWMIMEAMENIIFLLLDRKASFHLLGSKSEASTTPGLKSDTDMLTYPYYIQVIQKLSQWRPDILQYLMIQDETVSPGYCLLQRLRQDAPLPEHDFLDKHHIKDSSGRVLLRHSFLLGCIKGTPIHGPAHTHKFNLLGAYADFDFVVGLYCPMWPREAIPWLQQQNISGWPTEDMRRYSATEELFVVPVGSKQGSYPDLEWRISTSLAERCLMYNLNITQIRCYILMKMIIKTFLKPKYGDAVSSFMCKTILFHCIANSEVNCTWNEGSLLTRLKQCLQALLHHIQTENCPHFMIPRNNLLAGKLSAEVKCKLEDEIRTIAGNIEQSLLGIQIDNLGLRLYLKWHVSTIMHSIDSDVVLNTAHRHYFHEYDRCMSKFTSIPAVDQYVLKPAHGLIYTTSQGLLECKQIIEKEILSNGDANVQFLINIFSKLNLLNRDGSDFEKKAVSLLRPFLCTIIGSIKASADIQHSQNISPDALKWFSLGVNSDVSSSRLKKASALYCAGELEKSEMILEVVSGKMSHKIVQSLCRCNQLLPELSAGFGKLCYEKNEDVIKDMLAVCVTYMQCEINCIPGQLKYEMFRSTEEDRPYRDPKKHFWMDWAVVDSKPYLYFLQYMVYSQLHRPADQHRALDKLARTISTEPDLNHRETALNLLGQCMEHKNWLQLALFCYKRSLFVRRRNNAANWHVCRLLVHLLRSRSH